MPNLLVDGHICPTCSWMVTYAQLARGWSHMSDLLVDGHICQGESSRINLLKDILESSIIFLQYGVLCAGGGGGGER